MKRLVALVILICCLTYTAVNAQSTHLTITPNPSVHTGTAGSTVIAPLTLTNPNNSLVTAKITSQDYDQDPSPNEPPILRYSPLADFGMANWFTDANLQRTITVPAKQSIVYDAQFRVPAGAENRTYYTAIVFTPSDKYATPFVAPVVITVGNPSPLLSIEKLTYETSDDAQKRFGVFEAGVENTGVGLATMQAVLKITGPDGAEIATLHPDAATELLPASNQLLTFTLTSELPKDQVTATLTITDQMGKTIDASRQIGESEATSRPIAAEAGAVDPANYSMFVIVGCLALLALLIGVSMFILQRAKRRSKNLDQN